jgi:hypothetical protein
LHDCRNEGLSRAEARLMHGKMTLLPLPAKPSINIHATPQGMHAAHLPVTPISEWSNKNNKAMHSGGHRRFAIHHQQDGNDR